MLLLYLQFPENHSNAVEDHFFQGDESVHIPQHTGFTCLCVLAVQSHRHETLHRTVRHLANVLHLFLFRYHGQFNQSITD